MENLSLDNEGTISSFIILLSRLARNGRFIRLGRYLGEWDIVRLGQISALDYSSLILLGDGVRNQRMSWRERSRSPIRHRWHSPTPRVPSSIGGTSPSQFSYRSSPRSPSPLRSTSPSYSPVSSRPTSPLYSEADDDEVLEVSSDDETPEESLEPIANIEVHPLPVVPQPQPAVSPQVVVSPQPAVPAQPAAPAQLAVPQHPVPQLHHPPQAPVQLAHLLSSPRRNLCAVCKEIEAFTNIVYIRCRHMICELCSDGMTEHADPYKCPQCRTVGDFVRGIVQ